MCIDFVSRVRRTRITLVIREGLGGLAVGRHNASCIEAQKRVSGATALSAASFVGRVGSLALALGIGAAIAGGTAIAYAEGPTDNAAGDSAQSSPGPSTAETPSETPSDDGSTGTGSVDVKTRPPGSTNVPKMQLGNGRPGSLPELISSIPQKLATALNAHTPAAPPSRIRPHASDTATAAPRHQADPTQSGPPAGDVENPAPVTSRVPNAAAVRATVQPPAPAPAPAVNTIATVQITPTQPMPTQTRPAPANPIAMAVTNVLSALGISPQASSTGDPPTAPMPFVQSVLQLIHRELERFNMLPRNTVPSVSPGIPTPADEAPTVYGDIGKWMLQSNGQISNYGGLPYRGKTVLESVNVIIVDPTSTSAAESAHKLNTAMFWAGYPAQPIHSTGFQGTIDDITYGQQPTGPLMGFSDNFFLFPNNHGRIFGPDPVETSTGYVWSGAFSTEQFVIYDLLPRHAYVSSNLARNALAMRLIASGQATYGGMVPLNNSYNTATTTTGDHDGYAVVVILK